MTDVHYGTNDAGAHGQQIHDPRARALLPESEQRKAEREAHQQKAERNATFRPRGLGRVAPVERSKPCRLG